MKLERECISDRKSIENIKFKMDILKNSLFLKRDEPIAGESISSTIPSFLVQDGLTKQLLPTFKILRFLGRCPLLFEKNEYGFMDRIHYRFKISKNFGFIFSACFAILFLLLLIVELLQSGTLGIQLDYPIGIWPNCLARRQEIIKQVGKLIGVMLLSCQAVFINYVILEFFITWGTAPTLATWLNNWSEIESYWMLSFRRSWNLNISSFQKPFLFLYAGLPTLVFGSLIFFQDMKRDYLIATVFSLIPSYMGPMCLLMEDVKVVLMFKSLEMAFKEVMNSVEGHYSERPSTASLNMESRCEEIIRVWLKVITQIRNQCELTGQYLAVHQLLSIAVLIYLASATFFVVANLIGGGLYSPSGFMVIFAIIPFIRLAVKITMADNITKKERSLARLIKDVELKERDLVCQNELYKIHEMLSTRPSVISLNNYVTLNNSLILGVFGKILTQFVVLMQFQNSK